MHVGIVNFAINDPRTELYDVLTSLGCTVVIIQHTDDWLNIIRRSKIKRWICTGSAYDVLDKESPQLDTDLLQLDTKRFLLICYSMESILMQLGCRVRNWKNAKVDTIMISDDGTLIEVARNHFAHVDANSIKSRMKLLSAYKDDVMTIEYKNAMMTQWHPERTEDGKVFLKRWLHTK